MITIIVIHVYIIYIVVGRGTVRNLLFVSSGRCVKALFFITAAGGTRRKLHGHTQNDDFIQLSDFTVHSSVLKTTKKKNLYKKTFYRVWVSKFPCDSRRSIKKKNRFLPRDNELENAWKKSSRKRNITTVARFRCVLNKQRRTTLAFRSVFTIAKRFRRRKTRLR